MQILPGWQPDTVSALNAALPPIAARASPTTDNRRQPAQHRRWRPADCWVHKQPGQAFALRVPPCYSITLFCKNIQPAPHMKPQCGRNAAKATSTCSPKEGNRGRGGEYLGGRRCCCSRHHRTIEVPEVNCLVTDICHTARITSQSRYAFAASGPSCPYALLCSLSKPCHAPEDCSTNRLLPRHNSTAPRTWTLGRSQEGRSRSFRSLCRRRYSIHGTQAYAPRSKVPGINHLLTCCKETHNHVVKRPVTSPSATTLCEHTDTDNRKMLKSSVSR